MAESSPVTDIVQEAQRIVNSAQQNEIILRLFGGIAVRFHCPSATHRQLARKYADIDFMGLRRQSRGMKKLFTDLGYTPRDLFNRLHGDTRMIFNDIANGRRVDLFLDVFEMCHKLDLKDRLTINTPTIPLADLLFTKLQVIEITEREYRDVISLVHDHEIGDSDSPETINGQYLSKLCAEDWGIYKTLTTNIVNILNALPNYELESNDQEFVTKRLQELQTRIENTPKSMKWKMRAKIGEKRQWYELPEMDKEIIDSRVDTQRK